MSSALTISARGRGQSWKTTSTARHEALPSLWAASLAAKAGWAALNAAERWVLTNSLKSKEWPTRMTGLSEPENWTVETKSWILRARALGPSLLPAGGPPGGGQLGGSQSLSK